jgi:hypothetical protein
VAAADKTSCFVRSATCDSFAGRIESIPASRIGDNRPIPGIAGPEMTAAKLPFAACGKIKIMFRISSRWFCCLINS